jgi:hypothetical protein
MKSLSANSTVDQNRDNPEIGIVRGTRVQIVGTSWVKCPQAVPTRESRMPRTAVPRNPCNPTHRAFGCALRPGACASSANSVASTPLDLSRCCRRLGGKR